MSDVVYFPTLADAITLNRDFTGDGSVRDVGLLESALARPGASAFGHDAYPDLWSKAAALLHSMIRNHAFMDGNKRTGVLLALTTLGYNGIDVDHASPDALLDLAVAIANSDLSIEQITVGLRRAVESEA